MSGPSYGGPFECQACGDRRSRVIDKRNHENGRWVRRRRQCSGCGRRFTTHEITEEDAEALGRLAAVASLEGAGLS